MRKLCCTCIVLVMFFGLFAATAPELYQKGQEYQSKEDWYSAIEAYQEALKLNYAYGEVWFALAECSYATSQYELALNYLVSAEKYLSTSRDVLNLRGFALLGMENIDDAHTQFLQVLEEYPNDIQARFGLGELDLLDGKYSGAEKYYTEALKREGQNRKALLALALLSDKLGKTEAAHEYIKKALKYHSGSAEVHYFSGYIEAREGNLDIAEGYLRTAIILNGDYDKAYTLLASILFAEGRYQETIDICDYRISVDRNISLAWYLKGLSYRQLNNTDKAISALKSGLEIAPRDEVIRAALEMIVDESLELEDSQRTSLSLYHQKKGDEYDTLFYADQAKFEYLNALLLNPENTEARLSYANILEHAGFNEAYLSQLEFIQDQGFATQKMEDEIEALQTEMKVTIPKKWDVDTLYLDKNRWDVELFYTDSQIELLHAQVQEICAQRISSYMRSIPSVNLTVSESSSFSNAFKTAYLNKKDYFILLDFSETDREITINAELYSAKSGNLLNSYTVYRTGNDRFSIAILKFADLLLADLPEKGTIIDRNVSTVLIDLGTRDGVSVGDTFTIIKKGTLQQKATELGLSWSKNNELGTLTITNVGEEISEATAKKTGFYDVINIGDEIVLIKKSADDDSENTSAVNTKDTESEQQSFTLQKQAPVLYELIQSIAN
ncbi:MAG: hypothetical protein BKP49_08395 [Treponema sp. CETP13]|nr:MAG: hypothetical protein BKP49_08395 [Treponema sp. CETP13]